ncbi:hypothetical protein [uncultured Jatrophihabitans sp.]|uniref:hypothetical protein n=1 Tax=uncultured Jatrophihabitans sp. TaxID=1610747 RepID=UPI0035CA9680
MYRKILIGGMTAAAIVGAGGAALAVTGSDATTSGAAATTSAAASQHAAKGKQGKNKLLRRLAHGQFVTKGKGGVFVTHDLIRGTVTSVSATSITVEAADKKSETFVITKDTKVRMREDGKGSASTISKVATGDKVAVAGTGASTFTAKHVVDVKGAK